VYLHTTFFLSDGKRRKIKQLPQKSPITYAKIVQNIEMWIILPFQATKKAREYILPRLWPLNRCLVQAFCIAQEPIQSLLL
jgi:hypothetical protein